MQIIRVYLKGSSEPEVYETNNFGGAYPDGMYLKVVVHLTEDIDGDLQSVWQRTVLYQHDTVRKVEVEQQ